MNEVEGPCDGCKSLLMPSIETYSLSLFQSLYFVPPQYWIPWVYYQPQSDILDSHSRFHCCICFSTRDQPIQLKQHTVSSSCRFFCVCWRDHNIFCTILRIGKTNKKWLNHWIQMMNVNRMFGTKNLFFFWWALQHLL